jgi:ribonucleoside-diphosphate reductase alpha chain
MLVTKRDGSLEPLDLNKLHQVAFWSCENITGVSASELELKANLSFYDKIPTKEIQETLIKAAADLISEETPNYMHVGSRLINYALRKEVWGGIKPPHLAVHVSKIANDGHYDYELMDTFTTDEWDKMNSSTMIAIFSFPMSVWNSGAGSISFVTVLPTNSMRRRRLRLCSLPPVCSPNTTTV